MDADETIAVFCGSTCVAGVSVNTLGAVDFRLDSDALILLVSF
jgi:hypothetical protein